MSEELDALRRENRELRKLLDRFVHVWTDDSFEDMNKAATEFDKLVGAYAKVPAQ